MILLDPRIGSKHLAEHFDALSVPYELTHLEFGDAAFLGNGETGTVSVGVEVKNISDLVNSMASGRLAGHQIPGLLDRYGANVWLIVEGSYRARKGSDLLEVPKGVTWSPLSLGSRPVFVSDMENFLTTLEVQAGIHVRKTRDPRQTARTLGLLHGWWSRPYGEHRSLKVIHRPSLPIKLHTTDAVTAQIQRLACGLPGVGYERSWAIAKHFISPVAMALAGTSEWQRVSGVGKTGADRIVRAWHTERAA